MSFSPRLSHVLSTSGRWLAAVGFHVYPCRLLLSSCFCFSLVLADAPVWGEEPPPLTSEGRPAVEVANCVINVLEVPNWGAPTGLNVRDAIAECPDAVSRNSAMSCGSSIAGVIADLNAMGSFIAGAVATCRRIENTYAGCAALITGLISSISQVVQAALSMKDACPNPMPTNETDGKDVPWCVVSALQASGYLSQSGLAIEADRLICNQDRTICIVDALAVVANILQAGGEISYMASVCAKTANYPALCTSDALAIVGNLNGIASAAVAMNEVCRKVISPDIIIGPEQRRLGAQSAQGALAETGTSTATASSASSAEETPRRIVLV
eukprot:TRINITY_DN123464_c0_g1_i1.p1 TRINITY_DN123464_c0_g1~~TRINITY_DN123464_c0_g1_i1.p1  ORF type:complete len:367 (-),score=19.53 TRINITY_DN123464_c0_g1_i1:283-1263(-)